MQIDLFNKELSLEAAALVKEIKDIGYNVDYDKLIFTGDNKKPCGLKNFKTLEKLSKDIYNGDMAIDEADIKQNEFAKQLDELKSYPATGYKYIDLKESLSNGPKICYGEWEKNNARFKNKILPLTIKVGVINSQLF